MKVNKVRCYLLIGFLGITMLSWGQDIIPKPIIRHKRYSSMPDKIDIQGKIVEISYGHCGILCFGGTIKVELKEKVKGYNEIFIYVVVPCLERPPNDSTINVKATKLRSKEKECYFKSINNFIDSHGIPFYKLNELEASKITTGLRTTSGFVQWPSEYILSDRIKPSDISGWHGLLEI